MVVAGGGGGSFSYGVCTSNGGIGGYPSGVSGSAGCNLTVSVGESQTSEGVGADLGVDATLGWEGETPQSGGWDGVGRVIMVMVVVAGQVEAEVHLTVIDQYVLLLYILWLMRMAMEVLRFLYLQLNC